MTSRVRDGLRVREISDYFNRLPCVPPLSSRCLEVIIIIRKSTKANSIKCYIMLWR